MCNIAIEICELIVLSSSRGSTVCLSVCSAERRGARLYYMRCSYVFVFELYVVHGDYSNKHKLGRGLDVVVHHVVPNSHELLSSVLLKKTTKRTHKLKVFRFMSNAEPLKTQFLHLCSTEERRSHRFLKDTNNGQVIYC